MSNEGHVVRIAGTGSFLPNDPVGNDRIDAVLGELTGADPGVRRFLEGVGRRMLRQSGVESRHFAVDPSTGRLTHTVASLAEEAARRALATAGCEPRDVELLVLGTGNSDMTTPPTSALLQERLGIESCAEIEVHSNCAGLGKGVQIAVDALRVGRYERALVAYAQHSSSFLRAAWFNQARVTPQQAMLRYILSDGAAAIVLERDVGGTRGVDGAVRGEVLGTHVESVGGRRAAGMTMGGGVLDATRFDAPVLGGYEAGAHHLEQDFALVAKEAGTLLLDGLVRMLGRLGIDSAAIDHFVLSTPTRQLYDESRVRFRAALKGPDDGVRLPFRGTHTGYCGGASPLVHLDQMARAGALAPGQLVAVHAVESSKWMTGGFVVRW